MQSIETTPYETRSAMPTDMERKQNVIRVSYALTLAVSDSTYQLCVMTIKLGVASVPSGLCERNSKYAAYSVS